MGNFEQAVIHRPRNFGSIATERFVLRSTQQLKKPIPTQEDADRRWAFLVGLPDSHRDNDMLLVHGSPRATNEYVFPEDIYHPKKMDAIFAFIERNCFAGHTHVPGIFTADAQFHAPEDLDYLYPLDGHKVLCNVASVGQPRDGDWRACYVLFDGKTIRFRRVVCDVDGTVAKIRDNDNLDEI